ncbi:hypothetical protein [Cereibacter changlensis]|uniref:hypothetical protein n=1 Tax=Cereibacter changlensis TaxID=402884 RepID=UPI004033799A
MLIDAGQIITSGFVYRESGAVTVDWVVLTAAIVALGVLVFIPVFTGSSGVANKTAADLMIAITR